MANSVTTQILVDGPRNCVVKFEGILDTSDLASTVVVDPALLAGMDNTGTLKAAKLRVKKIIHNIEDGCALNLFWDATTPVRIESLNGRGAPDYHKWGGLINNAGAGVNGKITATTQGWIGGSVFSFSVILELEKTQ